MLNDSKFRTFACAYTATRRSIEIVHAWPRVQFEGGSYFTRGEFRAGTIRGREQIEGGNYYTVNAEIFNGHFNLTNEKNSL